MSTRILNEHSNNIDEGNLPNHPNNKEELPKDICIIPRIVEYDVGILVPKKFFQKTEVHPLFPSLLALEKILKRAIYNIFTEVE